MDDPALAGLALDEAGDPSPEFEQRSFTLGAAQHGGRLDRALADLVPEFSRNYLRQLIEAGAVTLNGRQVTKPSLSVKVGDTVLFKKYGPDEFELDGKKYLVGDEDDILAVLE